MLTLRLRFFFLLEAASIGLMGLSFGALIGLFVSKDGMTIAAALAGMGLSLALIGYLYVEEEIDTERRQANPLLPLPDDVQAPRRGLVCFVPMFRAGPESPAAALSRREVLHALYIGDAAGLHLDQPNNIQPLIAAALRHAPRLEHCWLICAFWPPRDGSFDTALFLEKYLCERLAAERDGGEPPRIHVGPPHQITVDSKEVILKESFSKLRAIFEEAAALGLPAQEMAVELSSAPDAVCMGMLLAAADRRCAISFAPTDSGVGPDGQEPLGYSFARAR